jgi:hypothetical protein
MHNLENAGESSVEELQNAEAHATSFLIWACFWMAALAILLPAFP